MRNLTSRVNRHPLCLTKKQTMINPAVGVGPNIATEDDENFFQSDRDILLKAERKRKQEALMEKGSPIQLLSKVLHFELVNDQIAYISQSGFITQKVDIKVTQIESCACSPVFSITDQEHISSFLPFLNNLCLSILFSSLIGWPNFGKL